MPAPKNRLSPRISATVSSPTKSRPDDEGLGEALGPGLDGVGEGQAELLAVPNRRL